MGRGGGGYTLLFQDSDLRQGAGQYTSTAYNVTSNVTLQAQLFILKQSRATALETTISTAADYISWMFLPAIDCNPSVLAARDELTLGGTNDIVTI